jgi:hypothetical protein
MKSFGRAPAPAGTRLGTDLGPRSPHNVARTSAEDGTRLLGRPSAPRGVLATTQGAGRGKIEEPAKTGLTDPPDPYVVEVCSR